MRGKDRVDLNVEPAPDLVIEVDLTSSSLNKQPIMAALGINEIWHYRDDTVTILRLVEENYQLTEESRCFPGITSNQLTAWIVAGQQSPRPVWLRQVQNEANQLI